MTWKIWFRFFKMILLLLNWRVVAEMQLMIIVKTKIERNWSALIVIKIYKIVFSIPFEVFYRHIHAIYFLTMVAIFLQQKEWIDGWQIYGCIVGAILTATEIYECVFVVDAFWKAAVSFVRIIKAVLVIPLYPALIKSWIDKKRKKRSLKEVSNPFRPQWYYVANRAGYYLHQRHSWDRASLCQRLGLTRSVRNKPRAQSASIERPKVRESAGGERRAKRVFRRRRKRFIMRALTQYF